MIRSSSEFRVSSAFRIPHSTFRIRAAGFSLAEVLVALFLMAIGVMGVLTMFPLGAVQMAQALKDQRCAEAATQADAYMRWYWRHYVVQVGGGAEPMWTALGTPTGTGPSPPVVVDPLMTAGVNGNTIVAGYSALPRVNLNQIGGNTSLALRTCTLLDNFSFANTGLPTTGNGTNIDRENRYSWCWILQRPSNSQPYTANMTVVVFNNRIQGSPVGDQAVGATFTLGQTAVALGTPLPQLQKGNWLLDASVAGGVQQATFYRVVSNTNNTTVELQTPTNPLGGGAYSSGEAIYMGNAVEVFVRPSLTQDNPVLP